MDTSNNDGSKMTEKGIICTKQKEIILYLMSGGIKHLTLLFKAIHWLLNCQTHHFLHDPTTHKKTKSGLFTCEKKGFQRVLTNTI